MFSCSLKLALQCCSQFTSNGRFGFDQIHLFLRVLFEVVQFQRCKRVVLHELPGPANQSFIALPAVKSGRLHAAQSTILVLAGSLRPQYWQEADRIEDFLQLVRRPASTMVGRGQKSAHDSSGSIVVSQRQAISQ